MKDLITSIGSIMILMIFLMQFAANQALIGKFILADTILGKYEEAAIAEDDKNSFDKIKQDISVVLGCEKSEVSTDISERGMCAVSAPVNNVIACGKILGITDNENRIIYKKHIKIKR